MDDESAPPRRFSPSIALLTFARLVEDRLEPALRARGLTLRKYAVLGHITAAPGISYSELARRSRITVQSTHTLIQSLVGAGLVQSDAPAAGMPARLSASAAGKRLLSEVADDVGQLDSELFGDAPLSELAGGLEAAIRSMAKEPPTAGLVLAVAWNKFGEAWLIAAMCVTVVAGVLYAVRIVPAQAAALAAPASRRALTVLGATTGVFNLLWVIVLVLMVWQPGGSHHA